MSLTSTLRHPFTKDHPEQVEQRASTVAPLVDVYENPDEIVLWADVPGATRDGVDVHIDKGQLTLSVRRARPAKDAPDAEATIHDYFRAFSVPAGIDAAKIDAELEAGVLKVRLPKSEALKPRRIDVKVS